VHNGKNIYGFDKNMATQMMDLEQKVKTYIYTPSQTQITVGEPRDQLFYLFSNVRSRKQKSTKDYCLVEVDKKIIT